MVSLYSLHYNFCRIHKTLKVHADDGGWVCPSELCDMEWIVGLIRRASADAEPPEDLPQAANFKLRHYPMKIRRLPPKFHGRKRA